MSRYNYFVLKIVNCVSFTSIESELVSTVLVFFYCNQALAVLFNIFLISPPTCFSQFFTSLSDRALQLDSLLVIILHLKPY